jgi:hypothetical protein
MPFIFFVALRTQKHWTPKDFTKKENLNFHNRVLIERLIENLRNVASDSMAAILTFETGLVEQTSKARDKLFSDLNNLRNSVNQTIQGVQDKVANSGVALMDCVNVIIIYIVLLFILIWFPGEKNGIAYLSFFHGCRKRRLKD